MLPKIWIFDTYSIMLIIGVVAAFLIVYYYLKKLNYKRNYRFDLLILGSVSVLIGLVFATLFQMLFNALNKDNTNPLFSMTFYGGLFGGVLGFILLYKLIIKKRYPEYSLIPTISTIAPAGIVIAHGFGRIGCFCAGCCYGKVTDSFLGVQFPDLPEKVYPTQLYEAIFLFILGTILLILAFKKNNLFTMPIYFISYGIWRFLIEFIRGDDRGKFILGLSPAQSLSIILVIIGIILIFYFKKFKEKNA